MKHFTFYNAQNFFVASSSPLAWLVKRYKLKSKKMCYVGHPNVHNCRTNHFHCDHLQTSISSVWQADWADTSQSSHLSVVTVRWQIMATQYSRDQNSPVSDHCVVAINCCGAPSHNNQYGHKQNEVFKLHISSPGSWWIRVGALEVGHPVVDEREDAGLPGPLPGQGYASVWHSLHQKCRWWGGRQSKTNLQICVNFQGFWTPVTVCANFDFLSRR